MGRVISDADRADVVVLQSHGLPTGGTFQLPDGTYANATDVRASNPSFSKVKLLVLTSCWSANGQLGQAFADKGAKIVLSGTGLQKDTDLGKFLAQFTKELSQGRTIADAFATAAQNTKINDVGETPFWDAKAGQVTGIQYNLAPGVGPYGSFNLTNAKQGAFQR